MEKCLAFCQGLVTSKQQFNFKLSLGKDSFDFNNKELANSSCRKKNKSPCQTRREERRRLERSQLVPKDATVKVTGVGKSNDFKCSNCDMEFGTEKGLKIHIGRAHKVPEATTPEKERSDNPLETSLTVSPLRETVREEKETNEVYEALPISVEMVEAPPIPKEELVQRHFSIKSLCKFNILNGHLESDLNKDVENILRFMRKKNYQESGPDMK